MKPTHVDLAGREIVHGDYIAYAAAWGRCPVLKYGKVVHMPIFQTKRIQKTIDVPKIQVVTVDRTSLAEGKWYIQGDNRWMGDYVPDPKQSTLVTLAFLDRLLVVDYKQVPPEAKKLLDMAYQARTYCDEHDILHMGNGCEMCPRKKRKK